MKNKAKTTSVYIALAFLIGSLGAAGCAIWVPEDSVAPQASEQTTTTTSQDVPVPVSTTKTTTVRSNNY